MAVARHQASGRRLADMAQQAGFALASTTFNHIRAGRYKSTPTDETIRAIGWLAGVSDEVAFAAAGQKAPGLPLADELPPGADHLSAKARKTIIDLTRVLIEYEADNDNAQDQPRNHDTPTPLRAVAPKGDTRPGQKTEPERFVDISIHDLAAHPYFETEHEKFERLHGERGEENQDPDSGNP